MGRLFIVPVPIGNPDDITLRALDTLENCSFIAAEHAKRTQKLLDIYGIDKEVIDYKEHISPEETDCIVRRISAGEDCALVSDAGSPLISDPGSVLIEKLNSINADIIPLPGACAAITALTVSSLSSGRFTFEGFLSVTKVSRYKHLESIKNEPRTMIFYEAPGKLISTLKDLFSVLGDRKISVSCDLTKATEYTFHTTLSSAIERYEAVPPRGEFVLIVEGISSNDK